jgi:hypothetical protein
MSRQSYRAVVGTFWFPERRGFCFGEHPDNLQNAFSAANYQTLEEIARIAKNAKIGKKCQK